MSDKAGAAILSVGSYVPDKIVTNDDLSETIETSDEWIFSRTGIHERRIARDDEYTSDMAIAAAKLALERAELEPKDIDYILVGTASPDNQFPNTACWVQKGMGMGDCPALDVSTACAGFVYALEVGAALLAGGAYRKILVIGAEKLSCITNWEDRDSCILFGDGAGAAVLGISSDRGQILCSRTGARFDFDALSLPAGGSRLPASHETVEAKQHAITLNGRAVYKFAVQKFAEMTREACARVGITPDDVALIVPHQANVNIIESAMKRVDVPMEKVVLNMDRFGNTSSASIPIALDEGVRDGRIQRGEYLLLLAFGGGLSWGYSMIKW